MHSVNGHLMSVTIDDDIPNRILRADWRQSTLAVDDDRVPELALKNFSQYARVPRSAGSLIGQLTE